MNFNIIPNEQTPVVPNIDIDINEYISINNAEFKEFIKFAESKADIAVGLAANQCSLNGKRFMKRAFAIKLYPESRYPTGNFFDGPFELIINPVIIKKEGMARKMSEGCLTWWSPRKQIIADRYKHIHVSYYRFNGEFIENERISGFKAQIWQHEVNHLNGVPEQIESLEYRIPSLKIGRNDQCPCNSGKKFKNCCI